jgi:signal transduction histidine kinase
LPETPAYSKPQVRPKLSTIRRLVPERPIAFPAQRTLDGCARRPEDRSIRQIEAGRPLPDAALAHDARNLLSALSVYCDLLASPGVLAPRYRHYAGDLRRVGETGARLLEALAANDDGRTVSPLDSTAEPVQQLSPPRIRRFTEIEDLGAEVLGMEGLLRALAGPDIHFEVECAPCPGALRLNSEELLRILFNLIANSVEAFSVSSPEIRRAGLTGRLESKPCLRANAFLRVTVQRGGGASFLPSRWRSPENCALPETVVLSVCDDGPGIATPDLARIFEPGFSTRSGGDRRVPRGLGLAIVRQLAEAAGGTVRAVSSPARGTCFDIELPLLPTTQQNSRDSEEERRSQNGNAELKKS